MSAQRSHSTTAGTTRGGSNLGSNKRDTHFSATNNWPAEYKLTTELTYTMWSMATCCEAKLPFADES